jgi:histidinol-phosphate aminotransferase
VKLLIAEREKMKKLLSDFPFVMQIFPSDANFILVKMHDARGIYEYLKENGVIVRDRSKVHLCEDSLRITIGSSEENGNLLTALKELI